MKYTYPIEEYRKQLLAYNKLEAMTFSSDDSREYVIAKLEERSAQKRVIADVANTMIREYIETFEKDPEALTEADAEVLRAFSESLFPDGGMTYSVGATDYGIFYRIEKLLAAHYRGEGDLERYVFALNRCSLCHVMLINGHVFHVQNALYREECLRLVPHLDDGTLSETTRSKVWFMLTREAITGDDHFAAEMFRHILRTLVSHMGQPPSATEKVNLFFFCILVHQMFRLHCIYAKNHGLAYDTETARPTLREVSDVLRELVAQNPGLDDNDEMRACFLNTDLLLGDIPLEEALDELTRLQRAAAGDPNPIKQAQRLCEFNDYYLTILYLFSDLPQEEIARLSRERIREVLPKLVSMSRLVNNSIFNRNIVEFLSAASLTGSFDEFAEIILESTVYADKALYIHTAMVREMSLAIFDYMIERTPEVFEGVAGRDAEYIRGHRDEMKQLLSDCCMFHDIGKFFMLDIVENSMRRLTDDEFGLIREHPENFLNIYRVINDKDERVLCIRDCALTHHLWHDGTRGYPKVPQTKNRPFADILAIADSIDAATDFLGRPYNSGKTIDQLIAEFQAGAGTHYGPEAAAALSAPEVRDRLHYWITEGRKEIYYRIYAFNKL